MFPIIFHIWIGLRRPFRITWRRDWQLLGHFRISANWRCSRGQIAFWDRLSRQSIPLIARGKDFRAMSRSLEVIYDLDNGKCASYAISCKVQNFSKLTVLKPIFAYSWSTRPFDALFENIEAPYTLGVDTRHPQLGAETNEKFFLIGPFESCVVSYSMRG